MSEFSKEEQRALEAATLFYQAVPNYLVASEGKDLLQRRLVELIDSLDVLEYTRSKDSFLAPVQNKAPYEVDYQRKRVILTIIDAYSLTEREGYVLRFLANGHNAAYIAEGLFVSLATVRSHINAIYRKLGVHSVKELGEFIDAYVIEE